MSLNQRVTAEFSTCTPSAPPTADLSIQTIRKLSQLIKADTRSKSIMRGELPRVAELLT
jgi:hypothetical protein